MDERTNSEVVGMDFQETAVILNSSLDTEFTSDLAESMGRLANSCASLEQAITDRLDIIEGRLDELKPGQPATVSSAGGHKRWTDRRDERVSKHFNRDEFVRNLQKAGTNGE